jgi:hypothetical protein
MLCRLFLVSALVTFAGIGISSGAVFFATADAKAQNRDAMHASVADLDALEKHLQSVASNVMPSAVAVGGGPARRLGSYRLSGRPCPESKSLRS